jgi:hypothetical protein
VGLTFRKRIKSFQKAKKYHWEGKNLFRVWLNGHVHGVPSPKVQESLARHLHEELKHFGVYQTYSLFQGQYWWRGMQLEVQQFVT